MRLYAQLLYTGFVAAHELFHGAAQHSYGLFAEACAKVGVVRQSEVRVEQDSSLAGVENLAEIPDDGIEHCIRILSASPAGIGLQGPKTFEKAHF